MDRTNITELFREHGADVAISALAFGPLLGWSYLIVGAGAIAGASMIMRMRRGEFMRVAAGAGIGAGHARIWNSTTTETP